MAVFALRFNYTSLLERSVRGQVHCMQYRCIKFKWKAQRNGRTLELFNCNV